MLENKNLIARTITCPYATLLCQSSLKLTSEFLDLHKHIYSSRKIRIKNHCCTFQIQKKPLGTFLNTFKHPSNTHQNSFETPLRHPSSTCITPSKTLEIFWNILDTSLKHSEWLKCSLLLNTPRQTDWVSLLELLIAAKTWTRKIYDWISSDLNNNLSILNN